MTAPRYQLPNPRGHAPLRRPNSLRRTVSIDATWPAGRHGGITMVGRARDSISTNPSTNGTAIHFDELHVIINAQKHIEKISSLVEQPHLQSLVGVHAMKSFRAKIDQLLQHQRNAGQPIYSLLNDMSGSLVATEWAWAQRSESFSPEAKALRIASLSKMESVCTGFSPHSSALHTDGLYQARMAADVIPLAHPEDPQGWHNLPDQGDSVSFRRARRLDIWLDEHIHIESTFQDSASTETGGRKAVHEYTVTAVFDRHSQTLLSIEATPHILPFPECPAAVAKLQRLVGVTALALRDEVSIRLRKVNGCTHLNEAARALAEAPTLINILLSYLDNTTN